MAAQISISGGERRSWWSRLFPAARRGCDHAEAKVRSVTLIDDEGDRCGKRYITECACGYARTTDCRW